MQPQLTDQDKQFILRVFSQLHINPLASDAQETVAMVQRIARILLADGEKNESESIKGEQDG
jgi:hypothetical protein